MYKQMYIVLHLFVEVRCCCKCLGRVLWLEACYFVLFSTGGQRKREVRVLMQGLLSLNRPFNHLLSLSEDGIVNRKAGSI